jgi:polyhydroxyalkanoate synthesis regulator phasin
MPQPKSSRSSSSRSSSSRARKPAAAKSTPAAKRTAAKPAAKRPAAKSSAAKRAPAKRTAAAKSTTARAATQTKAAASTSEAAVHANLSALRDHLRKGVVLTSDGVKSAMDDAVKRGKLTRKDATELTQNLLSSGRAQADGFRADLEHLLGRGRGAAAKSSDRVLREVDRARRRVGVGSSFPISLYDDLNASQIQTRLSDLTKPQLRKVRDYERRHGNRKSVLGAIERKLG